MSNNLFHNIDFQKIINALNKECNGKKVIFRKSSEIEEITGISRHSICIAFGMNKIDGYNILPWAQSRTTTWRIEKGE